MRKSVKQVKAQTCCEGQCRFEKDIAIVDLFDFASEISIHAAASCYQLSMLRAESIQQREELRKNRLEQQKVYSRLGWQKAIGRIFRTMFITFLMALIYMSFIIVLAAIINNLGVCA